MTKNKSKPYTETAASNDALRRILRHQMMDKGINVLQWKCKAWEDQHVPIPGWQIEKQLYESGCCTIFKDRATNEFYSLPVVTESIAESAYGLPTQWRTSAMGVQGGRLNNLRLTRDNAVLIWNDDLRSPTGAFIDHCIDMMVEAERNIYNNLITMRDEIVWIVDDYSVLDSKILQQKRKDGQLNIMKVSGVDNRPVGEVQNLGVEYHGADYSDLYNRYLNLAYAHMGLDSVQIDKKERALTDEINANNDSTAVMRASRLKYRLRAVADLKRLWPDLDVSVDVNPDLLKHDALMPGDEKPESDNNDV